MELNQNKTILTPGLFVSAKQLSNNNKTTPSKCFTVNNLQKGQQAEYWILRVKNIIKSKVSLTKACKKREPQDVQELLKEHCKVSINIDDKLCRTNSEVCPIILSRM